MSEQATNNQSERAFTGETVRALDDLGNVLQSIHRRLTAEGYIIKDGAYVQETNKS